MNYIPLVDQVIVAAELVAIVLLLLIIVRLALDDISWALALRACRKLNPAVPERRQGDGVPQ